MFTEIATSYLMWYNN